MRCYNSRNIYRLGFTFFYIITYFFLDQISEKQGEEVGTNLLKYDWKIDKNVFSLTN